MNSRLLCDFSTFSNFWTIFKCLGANKQILGWDKAWKRFLVCTCIEIKIFFLDISFVIFFHSDPSIFFVVILAFWSTTRLTLGLGKNKRNLLGLLIKSSNLYTLIFWLFNTINLGKFVLGYFLGSWSTLID